MDTFPKAVIDSGPLFDAQKLPAVFLDVSGVDTREAYDCSRHGRVIRPGKRAAQAVRAGSS